MIDGEGHPREAGAKKFVCACFPSDAPTRASPTFASSRLTFLFPPPSSSTLNNPSAPCALPSFAMKAVAAVTVLASVAAVHAVSTRLSKLVGIR